jgi:glycosyltransferase involved in cell wall biosynthesis
VVCVPLEDELFASKRVSVSSKVNTQPIGDRQMSAHYAGQHNDLKLLWNHRVEYDKGIDQFLALLLQLRNTHLPFKLILLGQRFRKLPESWQTLTMQFAEQILVNEFAETREAYFSWVQRADIVVSTACHEFQGLAVMEACVMGCVPLVPDRLSYPEYFPDQYRYQDLEQAVSWLLHWQQLRADENKINIEPPDLQSLSWHYQVKNYRDVINRLTEPNHPIGHG